MRSELLVRGALACAFLLAAMAAAHVTVAQDDDGDARDARSENANRGRGNASASASAPAHSENNTTAAEMALARRGLRGHFRAEDGEVSGTFVSFVLDLSQQDLLEVRIANATVFDAIRTAPSFRNFAPPGDTRSVVDYGGDQVRLRLHDNPTALLAMTARHSHGASGEETAVPDVAFTLEVADGVAVNRTDNRTIALSWDNASAHLHSDHDVGGDNRTLVVTGQSVFLVHERRVLLPAAANSNRNAIDEALSAGAVGAEVTVVRAEGDVVVTDTVATRDLAIEVNRTGDGLRVVVDAPEHRGTTLVLNVDRRLVAGDVSVRLWDVSVNATELSVARAASVGDVLDPHDDGLVPEYRLVRAHDGWQLLVSIPGFSAKMVELAPASSGLVPILPIAKEHPILVGGIFAAVLALGLAAAAMFRRPRPPP